MNFGGDKKMNVMYQCFENYTRQACCTSYQNPGKYQKLTSGKDTFEPENDDFITFEFVNSIARKIAPEF